VDEAVLVQRGADRPDAPVHHVRRRDDVHARLRLRKGLLAQHRDRFIVHDVAGVVDEAVLAVARVRIERDVRHHAELREVLLEIRDDARDEPLRVHRLLPVRGLERRLDRREERQGRDAELERVLRDREEAVRRVARDARHRRDGLLRIAALDHEHRVDQVVGRQPVLAHHAAREVVAPHAPHPDRRIAAVDVHGLGSSKVFCFPDGRLQRGRRSGEIAGNLFRPGRSDRKTASAVSRFSSLSGGLNHV
jgi:hypothetical protein